MIPGFLFFVLLEEGRDYQCISINTGKGERKEGRKEGKDACNSLVGYAHRCILVKGVHGGQERKHDGVALMNSQTEEHDLYKRVRQHRQCAHQNPRETPPQKKQEKSIMNS